jgi:hypothetical protein
VKLMVRLERRQVPARFNRVSEFVTGDNTWAL